MATISSLGQVKAFVYLLDSSWLTDIKVTLHMCCGYWNEEGKRNFYITNKCLVLLVVMGQLYVDPTSNGQVIFISSIYDHTANLP